jgi:sulfur relay (sulfurtransferase) DsrC/TusE family protein
MVQTSDAMREKQLNIRLTEDELARLQLVAEHYGLNVAGVLRMLVKREADAIGRAVEGQPVLPKKAKRKTK